MGKLNPAKLSPTGKYAHLLDDDTTGTEVRDYRVKDIYDYVYPKLIGDHAVAYAFAAKLDEEMPEWNQGTDAVTTWGDLIRDALDLFKEQVFPTPTDED